MRIKKETAAQRESIRKSQIEEIVRLIGSHLPRIESARLARRKYRVAVLGRARTALAPIALALREAGIPFRAVELEGLGDRPEILDAVSLTRALFNPEDRIAWLGLLRAPWCGLSLAELHTVAGTDEGSRVTTPVPRLLRERLDLLPTESQGAVKRVLSAYASADNIREALPTASAGTLIQQVWRALGGEACVDAVARANLDLYWRLLDNLPTGEQDLAGPALAAALEELCAMPDPRCSSDHGVQLMTIHKSKGLEFEVVIVPELQAQGGRGSLELLSWLERGLTEPDEDGGLTEFLIAPVQYKGTDPGAAKRWVDRARSEREKQEMRRILYVAATRARDELHFFAQPAYKLDADETKQLVEPSNCLLATAWPALEQEIRARFDALRDTVQPSTPLGNELILESIAAARGNVLVMPSQSRSTTIRRLPDNFDAQATGVVGRATSASIVGLDEAEAYVRHEGGLHSRALGNAVHGLLEQLSRLRKTFDWDSARKALETYKPRMIASIRGSGITAPQAEAIGARAFEAAIAATHDPGGQWILSPHAEAATESGWAGLISGGLRQIRVDRFFRAGLAPLEAGDDTLWIIDYKTAGVDPANAASTVAALRETFAPQVEMYATILRNLHPADAPIRAGIYYPRMAIFDWWEI